MMMWKVIHQNSSDDWEPPELRKLKYQLANLTCECSTCTRKSRDSISHLEKEVQVEQKPPSIDQFIQVNHFTPSNFQYFGKELCPSCFIALNLFRGSITKVMKDEESETNRQMVTCDKGTRKSINYAEKTTSFTIDPTLEDSNLTFTDEKFSREITETKRKQCCHRERVKFVSSAKNEVEQPAMGIYNECSYLDRFIDSIRPPLLDK